MSVEVGSLVEPLRIGDAGAIRVFLIKLTLHHIAIDLVGRPHDVAHIEKIITNSEPYSRRDVIAQLDLRLRDNRKFVLGAGSRIRRCCEYPVWPARGEEVAGLVRAVDADCLVVDAQCCSQRRFQREWSKTAERAQAEQ